MKEIELFYELALIINQELYNEEKISLKVYKSIQEKILKRKSKTNGSI